MADRYTPALFGEPTSYDLIGPPPFELKRLDSPIIISRLLIHEFLLLWDSPHPDIL
jgi:hypothetical protein